MIIIKILVVPILIFLYLVVAMPLVLRDIMHLMCIYLDGAFDYTAKFAGFTPGLWPLPKASDNPLPYQN